MSTSTPMFMKEVPVDTHDLASHVVEVVPVVPTVPVEITAVNCDVEGVVVSIHHVSKRSIMSE